MNRAEDPRDELERALAQLAGWIDERKKPTRHQARALLVALGRWIRHGAPSGDQVSAVRDRLRAIVHPLAEGWEAAVLDELILACTEHIRSVDPRYLDHPRYDFAYPIEARERLESRLVAAAALGMSPSPELLARVTRADELLRPYVRRFQERDRGPGPT
jgi:hypothetical protein